MWKYSFNDDDVADNDNDNTGNIITVIIILTKLIFTKEEGLVVDILPSKQIIYPAN